MRQGKTVIKCEDNFSMGGERGGFRHISKVGEFFFKIAAKMFCIGTVMKQQRKREGLLDVDCVLVALGTYFLDGECPPPSHSPASRGFPVSFLYDYTMSPRQCLLVIASMIRAIHSLFPLTSLSISPFLHYHLTVVDGDIISSYLSTSTSYLKW